MKDELVNVSQASVAQALASDYFCIYFVNTASDRFIEYSASLEFKMLGLPVTGDDFISFSRERFEEFVHEDDRERFLETFTKENIVSSLDDHSIFTMTFRMYLNGSSTYVHLKVTRLIEEDRRHAVIGISSIDEQMKALEAFEQAHRDSITYSRVAQALTSDYYSTYVVDADTDRFIEYSATSEYDQLGVEKSGEDFFNLSRKNMERLISPEDRDRFMGTFTKEKVLSILERDGSFTMKYRLMFGDTPVWVSMKATLLDDKDGRHIIIGTYNIDAQMRREEEYRKRIAEAKTNAKNDFLANMSHDIRTPMNAIVGYTNIALDRINDPDAVRDSLEKISSSSHFLLSLINDILDISKIESGKMLLSPAPCDLAAIFRRIEDITCLQAKNKSLNIRYDHDRVRHFHVLADELRMEQILINIVSNAIKYTPDGKDVTLIAEETGTGADGMIRYRFIIRDTGLGISEEYLPHIFDSFTREQRTTINRVQGTGLGLAITAKVVELMGGTINVKSKLGEGSEFTVELELESLDEPEETGSGDQNSGFDELSGKRILVVEDNDINAEIVCMVLQQYGILADRADNGQTGTEILRNSEAGTYDAVLMDIQMPVMNGFEATEAIRSFDSRVPVIAMSANAYEKDVQACLDAGMNAHIAKPFQPEQLLKMLRKYLGGR